MTEKSGIATLHCVRNDFILCVVTLQSLEDTELVDVRVQRYLIKSMISYIFSRQILTFCQCQSIVSIVSFSEITRKAKKVESFFLTNCEVFCKPANRFRSCQSNGSVLGVGDSDHQPQKTFSLPRYPPSLRKTPKSSRDKQRLRLIPKKSSKFDCNLWNVTNPFTLDHQYD